ncbi:MAG: carbohydrate kinase family protein [Pirellulaceae bacterium]|nr:carbohydrate kinase family protein [Pirellulaceae bacterium]
MSLDIVAIGHVINETIIYPQQKTRQVLGSPPAYSMAVAAGVGAQVGILTRIGTDYPRELLEPLQTLGVDLQGIVCRGEVSTNNQLIYSDNGTKEIQYLTKAPLIDIADTPTSYRKAKLFYVCPMDFDVTTNTVKEFSELGGMMATDLGGFGGAHSPPGQSPQMQRDPETVRALIASMDIVKASDEDCQRLTGDATVDLAGFAEQWLDWGAKISVVTLGGAGALVITRKQTHHIPPLPGNPIDPTGGGDSFMGGFLVRYLQTEDAWQAGIYGAATALLVIEGSGGVSVDRMPSAPLVEQRLQQAGLSG